MSRYYWAIMALVGLLFATIVSAEESSLGKIFVNINLQIHLHIWIIILIILEYLTR